MSGLHFSIEELAPPTAHRGIAKGDIVTFAWQRKRIYGWVLSWSGDADKTCRLIDLRYQIHNRFSDSLTRETDADELAILEPRFHELLQSKKGKAAIAPPIVSEWAGMSGHGHPDIHDAPLVTTDGSTSNINSRMLAYLMHGGSERAYLRQLHQEDSDMHRRVVSGSRPFAGRYQVAA